ncbi:MAG TPA: hypothetical protein VFM18_02810, partial [Methanosarcina sp.]|nr:hypothetical protein [Methanosarcina sp.]
TQHMYVFDITFMMISGYRTEPIPAIIPSIKFFDFIRIAYLPQSPTSQANTQGIHVSFEHKF